MRHTTAPTSTAKHFAAASVLLMALPSVLTAQTQGSPEPLTRPELCERFTKSDNRYFGRHHEAAATSNLSDSASLQKARRSLEQGHFQDAIAATAQRLALPVSSAQPASRLQALWIAGLANLRLAETANCLGEAHVEGSAIERRDLRADTCILPLTKAALHRDPAAAGSAAKHFLEILRHQPRDPTAAWLANLTATLADTPDLVPSRYRIALKSPADAPSRTWRNIAPILGLDVTDLAGGAAIEDLDGDGLLDVITSTQDPCGGLTVFRNAGNAGFRDVTADWDLDDVAGGLNLFTADYDNDGRVDLFVTRGAWLLSDGLLNNSLLRNTAGTKGAPVFRDVTREVGLSQLAAPSQAATFADFDNDGDLDLYLGNEATAASPHSSQLLRNDLDSQTQTRHFIDVTRAAGVENFRYAKAVTAGDVDNDGDQDLYVSNFGLNRLYLNQFSQSGELRFLDRARALNVTEPSVQSFATWLFDFDNDGDQDLFVADYQQQPDRVAASYFPPASWIGRALRPGSQGLGGQPLLYRNLLADTGSLAFEEVSQSLGLQRPAMPMGANFGDLDGDGWLDLYLGTGEPNLASQFPNQAYRNDGGHFVDVTFSSGLAHLQKGHGTAFGDLDNDGDLDLLHQLGGFYRGDPGSNALFENLSQGGDATHHWITLRFVGVTANRFAIGARVQIEVADPSGQQTRTLHRTVGTGGSFGASSMQLEVGLGQASIKSVEIDWPGGKRQIFAGLKRDAVYQLTEGRSRAIKVSTQSHQMTPTADHPEHQP